MSRIRNVIHFLEESGFCEENEFRRNKKLYWSKEAKTVAIRFYLDHGVIDVRTVSSRCTFYFSTSLVEELYDQVVSIGSSTEYHPDEMMINIMISFLNEVDHLVEIVSVTKAYFTDKYVWFNKFSFDLKSRRYSFIFDNISPGIGDSFDEYNRSTIEFSEEGVRFYGERDIPRRTCSIVNS